MATPTIQINSDECVYLEIGDWTINIDISIPNDGVMVMYWQTSEDGSTLHLDHTLRKVGGITLPHTGEKHDEE